MGQIKAPNADQCALAVGHIQWTMRQPLQQVWHKVGLLLCCT